MDVFSSHLSIGLPNSLRPAALQAAAASLGITSAPRQQSQELQQPQQPQQQPQQPQPTPSQPPSSGTSGITSKTSRCIDTVSAPPAKPVDPADAAAAPAPSDAKAALPPKPPPSGLEAGQRLSLYQAMLLAAVRSGASNEELQVCDQLALLSYTDLAMCLGPDQLYRHARECLSL